MKKFREYVVEFNGKKIVYGSYAVKGTTENLINALNTIKSVLGNASYKEALYSGNYKTYLNKDGLY